MDTLDRDSTVTAELRLARHQLALIRQLISHFPNGVPAGVLALACTCNETMSLSVLLAHHEAARKSGHTP